MNRFVFFCFIFLPFLSFSQQEASNWYFGRRAGITFNTTPPSLLTDGELITKEGCSSMSDANGNLLFYTDGWTIWNRNHQEMSNADYLGGTGLMGDPASTSSALIVPHPSNPDLYYVFTVDEPNPENLAGNPPGPQTDTSFGQTGGGWPIYIDDGYNNGLNYSVVDMTLNNGLGDVIQGKRNLHLVTYPTDGGPLGLHRAEKYKCSEKLTAARGKGCDEYWVVTRFIDTFYAFKIDGNGVHQTPVTSKVGPTVTFGDYELSSSSSGGYMKFSPDGTMLLAVHNNYNPRGEPRRSSVYLYDFNKNTGKITDPISLYNGQVPMYGVEFSLGSTKAYATTKMAAIPPVNVLYQWDLEANNIQASRFSFPNVHALGTLQLAPNGKIYVASLGSQSLYVINHPELTGLPADYVEHTSNGAIDLGTGLAGEGLPQFMPSLFFPWIRINIIDDSEDIKTKLSICELEEYTLGYEVSLPGQVTYTWYKNEVVIPGAISNTLTIQPPAVGTTLPFQVNYKLEIIQVNNGCTLKYRGIAKVTYNPLPNIFNATLVQCKMDNATNTIFNLNQAREEIIGNAPVEDYSFKFYPSLADAHNEAGQITNVTAYQNTSNPQTIGVMVINNESGCHSFVELTLTVNQNGINHSAIEISSCDTNQNGLHLFDLTSVIPEITNGNTQLDVNFHTSLQETYSELNPIETPLNYYNTGSPYIQIIYARMENNGVCAGIREIELTVTELPPVGPDLTGENSIIYCVENLPEDISLSSGIPKNQEGNYTFLWKPSGETTSTIHTHAFGTHTVTVTDIETGCKATRTIDIAPVETASFILEHNDPSDNNTITVVLDEDSQGNYEYALDGGPFQDSNIFEMVSAGIHIVYVRNQYGCGVTKQEVAILGLMKFFTPNGDGINDYWNLLGVGDGYEMFAELYIYDRYGKLLNSSYGRTLGWDGTYNGKRMPSNDYWYCIVLEDGRTVKGNFTLKR